MSDQKTQYVTVHDSAPSPPSSALLSPRTKSAQGLFRFRQSAHRFWLLEVGASVLSLLMFMAILIILWDLDDQVYGAASGDQGDKNKRPHIFPILAFLSAVMRATMLLPVATAIGQLKWSWFRSPRRLVDIERFDEAARGILGSAKLFFYLRFRCVRTRERYEEKFTNLSIYRNLACIGAALTILALPLDALIQSSIRMPSKVESVNYLRERSPEFLTYPNQTFLERAASYSESQTFTDNDIPWAETPMVNAIQFGLGYSNGPSNFITAETNVVCPTGYCNFTKSQTLSVAHSCAFRNDIQNVPQNETGTETLAPYQTLPGTDLRIYSQGYTGAFKQKISAATYAKYPVPKPILPYETGAYADDPLSGIDWPLIARTSMLFSWAPDNWTNGTDYTYAIDCGLYWTFRTTQMYVNDVSNFTLKSNDDNVTFVPEYDDQRRWVLRPTTCFVDGQQVPDASESSHNDTYWRDNCVFWVSDYAHVGVQNLLTDPTRGFIGNLTYLDRDMNKWNDRNTFTMNLEAASAGQTREDTFNNIDTMWQNIAFFAAFTVRGGESIQTNADPVNLNVTGTVYALVTYYSIDWLRLTMPAFIIVCCALFVLYTAVSTRKEYAWRRSALPLLFHGLEDQERYAQGDVRDFNAMQDAAKEIRVRLTEHVDENGARLTTQN
jgi:hypothetical protein